MIADEERPAHSLLTQRCRRAGMHLQNASAEECSFYQDGVPLGSPIAVVALFPRLCPLFLMFLLGFWGCITERSGCRLVHMSHGVIDGRLSATIGLLGAASSDLSACMLAASNMHLAYERARCS